MHRTKAQLVEFLRLEKRNNQILTRTNTHISNVIENMTSNMKDKLQKKIDNDKLTFDERNAAVNMIEFIDEQLLDAAKYANSLFSIPDLDYTDERFKEKSPHDRLLEKGWGYDERDDVYTFGESTLYLDYSDKTYNIESKYSHRIDIDTVAIIYALLKNRGNII